MKEGKEVLKTKGRDDKEEKLDNLEQRWDNVCQLLVARQQKLEEAEEKLAQFSHQLSVIKAQMSKLAIPFLDITEHVHGDVDTVRELLETHTVSNTSVYYM